MMYLSLFSFYVILLVRIQRITSPYLSFLLTAMRLASLFLKIVKHEPDKKVKYGERLTQVEKGSSCPFIFSTSGGVGTLCGNLHEKLASRIAIKMKERHGHVIRCVRTKFKFALLKFVLMGVRSIQGKNFGHSEVQLADVSFDLIHQVSF